MTTARITIDLSEYESLNRTIQEKNEYIQECVVNGKIKRVDVDHYIFSKDISIFSYGFGRHGFVSGCYERYLSQEAIDGINNEELKKAIAEIYKQKDKWECDFESQKVAEIEHYIETKIESKSFIERLVYLFTGNFS